MTRKRFIRLLMAEGVQRNKAHEVAWTTQKSGVPYADAWFNMHNPLIISFKMFVEAFRKAALEAGKAIRRIGAQFSAISELAGGWEHENTGD